VEGSYASMKIEKTAVRTNASGAYEQELSYRMEEKLRREIFVEFDCDRLARVIEERVREIRTKEREKS
jgi:hypothetical protein